MRFLIFLAPTILVLNLLTGCEERYNNFISGDEDQAQSSDTENKYQDFLDENPEVKEQVDELKDELKELESNPDSKSDKEIQDRIDEIKSEIDNVVDKNINDDKTGSGALIPQEPDSGDSSNENSEDSGFDQSTDMEDIIEEAEKVKDALDELSKELTDIDSEDKVEDTSVCNQPVDNMGAVPPSFTAYEQNCL